MLKPFQLLRGVLPCSGSLRSTPSLTRRSTYPYVFRQVEAEVNPSSLCHLHQKFKARPFYQGCSIYLGHAQAYLPNPCYHGLLPSLRALFGPRLFTDKNDQPLTLSSAFLCAIHITSSTNPWASVFFRATDFALELLLQPSDVALQIIISRTWAGGLVMHINYCLLEL